MQIDKAKTSAVITIVLLMASVTLMAMPVKAQEGAHGGEPGAPQWGPLPAGVTPDVTVITYAYLNVRPNPVGVGQSALINIWTTPSASDSVYATGYTVTMTKPDNTTVTVGPMNSYYADRTTWFEYIFDQVGTWKLKFDYPGNYYPPGTYGVGVLGSSPTNVTLSRWYKPSSTPFVTELIVQQEQVLSWPPAPLPTHEYWTRPVPVMNREWWPLLGNYPWSGSGEGWPDWPEGTNYFKANTKYNAWVTAPNSAHIVWKRQDAISGLIGAEAGIISTATVSASTPGLIYAGRCYQTMTIPVDGVPTSCATCYDLRTGEQYYAIPTSEGGTTPSAISYVMGTAYLGMGPEVPGGTAIEGCTVELLSVGARLLKINPWNGAVTTNVTGMSGTLIGNYVITIQTNNTATGPRWINWTTVGTSANFASRIMENRTYNSTSIGSNVDWQAGVFGSISTISPSPQAPTGCRILGYSLQTGELICNFTDTYVPYQTSTVAVDHGKIACLMVDGYDVCYDLRQGKRVWVSQQTYSVGGYPWGIWGAYSSASYGGNHILCLYDGIYAFNWETGKISWVYKAPSVAFETPYAGWTSFDSGVSIADGKIFVANSEHTPSQPITRGWKLHCINATTGEGIWNISAGGGAMGGGYAIGAMADGYLTAGGTDGYMYVFGRGKSATTVTATPAVIANGATVLIQGTVLDQSPAQPGAACVSDGSQATYMEYLHIQQPLDGIFHNITITGVPVLLLAVDSDGTVTNIGTTTSDVSGCFKTAWTPPKEGVYTVTATFAGSESYGSSWAETAVAVGPAPASPTPTPTPPAAAPAPDTTPYIIGMGIAIIIAVAIVGILLLRKRP